MFYESKILNVTLRKPKIHLISDVVYSQVPTFEIPNKALLMDILLPSVNKKMPAVIFVTGGGFIAANKSRMIQLRMHLAENNFVVASITYRTIPTCKFPAPLEDVKSAIRFLKANAQNFNVDSDKIFLIGDSAGGYLAAFQTLPFQVKFLRLSIYTAFPILQKLRRTFPRICRRLTICRAQYRHFL